MLCFVLVFTCVHLKLLCFAVPAVPKPHEGAGGVLQENQGGRPEV